MIDRIIFSERLIALKQKQGVTGVAIAEALGIKKQSYYAWETGKAIPSSETLVALADYFGVSLDYLVGRSTTSERVP